MSDTGTGVHGAGLLDRLEPIIFCNAPCESGQKRPLFKLSTPIFEAGSYQFRQLVISLI